MPSRAQGCITTCEGFDILCQNTTPAALYGFSALSKDPGCLHGTRLNVQDHIFKWLGNPESEVAMWMYGPAGIGKTAIAQTVAKLCAERAQLSSAFFFFRSDDGRNSAKHLVPTLAFEMVQQMPHTRDVVCTAASNNPLIFSLSLERQIRRIILPALSEPFPRSQATPPGPMLFIIDGLDECTDTGIQQLIIRTFISTLAATATTIRHKVLLVSRPESHIVSTFSAVNLSQHVDHICLDEWNSIADIAIFLRAELKVIKQTHPLKCYFDAEWPSEEAFKKLLHKSFESFAYASSAIRYISSHDRHPEVSLNNVLGLTPNRAYEAHAELDSLYRHILERLDEETRFTVRKILCLHAYLSAGDIGSLACLLGEETFVVELAITKMSSTIRFDNPRISYYHRSFNDFLLDKERSGALYLHSSDISSAVAKALFRLWVSPSTARHYTLLRQIGHRLCLNISSVDMHIHILRAFLATCLPTTIAVSPNISRILIIQTFHELFESIEWGSRWERYPAALKYLFREAFQHLSAWLRSQVGQDTCTLETFLDITFMPALSQPPSHADRPHSWDILFYLVRRNDDPWRILCRLLPGEDTSMILKGLVKRYLVMPEEARREDIRTHTTQRFPLKYGALTTLTGTLIRVLQSEATRAEICHMLEQIVLEGMLASARQMTPQGFISFRLCHDTGESTQSSTTQWLYQRSSESIAKPMDLYIRKTHAEQHHLPYISEGVRRLYCDTVSRPDDTDAGSIPPGED